MNLTSDDLTARLDFASDQTGYPVTVEVQLGKGDTAWDPSSTSRTVTGPAMLAYTQHADGGIDLTVDYGMGQA